MLILTPNKKLIAPSLHLNGTGARGLQRLYMDAANATMGAIEKLRAAGPHGRDYYVQDEGTCERARAEHQARLDKLQDVLEELSDLMEAVTP